MKPYNKNRLAYKKHDQAKMEQSIVQIFYIYFHFPVYFETINKITD